MSSNKKKRLNKMIDILAKAPEKEEEGKQPSTKSGKVTESDNMTESVNMTNQDSMTNQVRMTESVSKTSHDRKTKSVSKTKSVKKTKTVRMSDKDKPAHHDFKLIQLKELMPSGKVDRQILRRFKAFVDDNLETGLISQSDILGENAHKSYYRSRMVSLILQGHYLKIFEDHRVGVRSKLGKRFKALLPIWPNDELEVSKLSDENLDKEFYLSTLAVQDGEGQYLEHLLRIKMEKERRG